MSRLNPYFTPYSENGNANEQDLYSHMIRENIEMSGQDYIYIPRVISERFDPIFGEDVLSSFENHARVAMWVENYNGYSGESETLAKFGLEIRDSASFIIHRDEFKEQVVPIVPVSRNEKLKWRPNEGDLIYVPYSQSLFQIKFVEDEYPGFYQLKKKYVWALRCELIQLNNEKFKTDVVEIDEIFNMNIDRLNNTLIMENGFKFLKEELGNFVLEEYTNNKGVDEHVNYGDDDQIKSEFLDIVDWSEANPFGD